MFQFHTGSIKSWEADLAFPATGSFQFHTGSIKSIPIQSVFPLHRCFNSILVRLKVNISTQLRLMDLISFNSILVRLKVSSFVLSETISTVFQFHTGSIKREQICKRDNKETSFNSILVRLKVSWRSIMKACVTCVSIPYWFD